VKHAHSGIEKRVAVFGCKHTTRDLVLGLARRGLRVDHCVTISPEKAASQHVAGYQDLHPFLEEQEIDFTVANKYSLKSEQDEAAIGKLNLDIVLCMGWQRLVPDWCLSRLSIGAFGMHGSNKPLPHGRGRSPMNWSLIQNKKMFFTHLFQYKIGVDDGPIVGLQKFDITEWDDCHTLHFKNTLSMVHLCARHLPELIDGSATFTSQPTEGACYYPKRTAEDGAIYWQDATTDVHNLVRALTRPFPGAFTFLDDDPQQKLFIWRAIPFDSRLDWPGARPGEILEVFYDSSFVVKTGDTSVLVIDSEGVEIGETHIGRRFGHLRQERKAWPDLPT
jgi:methionyl-tRNA formyltransferase